MTIFEGNTLPPATAMVTWYLIKAPRMGWSSGRVNPPFSGRILCFPFPTFPIDFENSQCDNLQIWIWCAFLHLGLEKMNIFPEPIVKLPTDYVRNCLFRYQWQVPFPKHSLESTGPFVKRKRLPKSPQRTGSQQVKLIDFGMCTVNRTLVMCASFRGPFFWVVWKYSLLFCLGGAVEERYQILSTSKQTGRVVTQQSTSIRVFPKIVVPQNGWWK